MGLDGIRTGPKRISDKPKLSVSCRKVSGLAKAYDKLAALVPGKSAQGEPPSVRDKDKEQQALSFPPVTTELAGHLLMADFEVMEVTNF